jgi:hypothetical protein
MAALQTSTRPLPGATTCWPKPASLTPFATALRSMSNNSALAGHADAPIWRPRPPPYKNYRSTKSSRNPLPPLRRFLNFDKHRAV